MSIEFIDFCTSEMFAKAMEFRTNPKYPLHKILSVGKEQIVQYYWGKIPEKVPDHWTAKPEDPDAKYADGPWQRYLHNLNPDQDQNLCIESVSLYDNTVFVDPWMGSYKWSPARTMYHPSVVVIRDRLLAVGLITPRTKFVLGNWASGKVYSVLADTAAQVIQWSMEKELRLWHGTTQGRAQEIQKHGFEPLETNRGRFYEDGVYFSGEAFRASYFAKSIGKIAGTRDKNKKMGPDFKVPVTIELVIPESEFHRLRADDDWMGAELFQRFEEEHGSIYSGEEGEGQKKWGAYQRKHKKSLFEELAPRWQDSLRDFGQVAILGALGPKHIVTTEACTQ